MIQVTYICDLCQRERRFSSSFTAEEIRRGEHWLYADVKCESCGKVQLLAMSGSTDNGKCIKCGGKTS